VKGKKNSPPTVEVGFPEKQPGGFKGESLMGKRQGAVDWG